MNQDSADVSPVFWNPLRSPEDAVRLAVLAEGIWYVHYTPIVGSAQIRHMLRELHSPENLQSWMQAPDMEIAAISIREQGPWVGYVLLQHGNPVPGQTLLSKFYLVESVRGQGLGRVMLREIRERSLRAGSERLWLTANRRNDQANAVYERLGFRRAREWAQPVGGGYVMDDYVWELDLRTPASPR